jgi:hypothetical protein
MGLTKAWRAEPRPTQALDKILSDIFSGNLRLREKNLRPLFLKKIFSKKLNREWF